MQFYIMSDKQKTHNKASYNEGMNSELINNKSCTV